MLDIGSWHGEAVHFEIPATEPADNPTPLPAEPVSFDLRIPAAAFALPNAEDREVRLDGKTPWPLELRRGMRLRIRMQGNTLEAVVLSRRGKRLTMRGRFTR